MLRVVHFEIPADDTERANEFYAGVFGWDMKQFGDQDYWFANTGDPNVPGINGAVMKRKHPQQPVVNSISVPSVDDYVKKVTEAGGQIVVPKFTVAGAGYLAFFKDTEGNIFGLWQDDTSAK
jgi:uncharacterized protein